MYANFLTQNKIGNLFFYRAGRSHKIGTISCSKSHSALFFGGEKKTWVVSIYRDINIAVLRESGVRIKPDYPALSASNFA